MRTAIVLAAILGALGFVAGIVSFLLSPEFVSRHLSADGELSPFTQSWLLKYRATAGITALALLASGGLVWIRRARWGTWFESGALGLRRGLLALGSTALVLVVLEVALRLLETRRSVSPRGHDFAADAREFMEAVASQRNADGFRDDPFDRVRVAGERRILLIGDSFAFGFGILDREATLAANLERDLSRELPCDVFNAGVPGADTNRQLAVLDASMNRIDPDLVLIAWYVNDAESEEDKRTYVEQSRLIPLISDVLLRSSALWRLVEPALIELSIERGWKRSYVEHLRRLHDPPHGNAWTQRNAFIESIAIARRDGRHVAVVLFPQLERFDPYPLADVHAVVSAACTRASVPCLDLLTVLHTEDPPTLQVSALDHHLNERGSALAAAAITRFLRDTPDLLAARKTAR